MSVSKFPAERKPTFIPVGQSASYAFPDTVNAGMYLIETDTTQSIAASNCYVTSAEGFRFGATIRGGQGYLPLPISADSISITSGTFPMPITLTKMDYLLGAAPSASVSEYSPGSLSFIVDLPAGSSGFRYFWSNGTSASQSGSVASVALPVSLPTNVGIAAIDQNGVITLVDGKTVPLRYFEFTSSSTFIVPVGAVSADLYLVGAGGGGGTGTITGGGGGGNWVFVPAHPVASGSLSIVIGAGGAATAGNATTVGSASAAGGFASTTDAGASSAEPFAGGTADGPSGLRAAGGGGGETAVGGNGSAPTGPFIARGGSGGTGKPVILANFPVSVGGGGGGGSRSPSGASPSSGGGAGTDGGGSGGYQNPSPNPVIQFGSAGGNGSANRGGGGGGTGAATSVTGSSGGSGRVMVKLNF